MNLRPREIEKHESGDKWLGVLPVHWEARRARHLGTFTGSGIDKKYNDSEVPVKMINYTDVYKSLSKVLRYSDSLMSTTAPPSKAVEHAVQEGDILLTPSSETADDIGHAALVASMPERVVYSYHILRYRLTADSNARYLTYCFNAHPTRAFFSSVCTGTTRMVLGRDDFKDTPIALPSLDEQTAIANFLDRETAKIDTLIDKQEQLIKLLEEKRQAVISHAVTKGLNPDVRMKDSGVEWLGEVPEHWALTRLKHLIAALESGTSVNAEDTPAGEGQIGVLKTSCVYTREFRGEENKTVFVEELERVKCPLRTGQIVISRMNTPDLVGAAAYVDQEYSGIYLPDRLWQTRFFDESKQEPKYIAQYMSIRGFRDQIAIYAEGASGSMKSIAKEDFLSIPALLPPPEEQNVIVQNLKKRLDQLDQVRQNGQHQVELLRERRTALISAAVTGKIDVRNAV